jgi:RHS repeat-associated protein
MPCETCCPPGANGPGGSGAGGGCGPAGCGGISSGGSGPKKTASGASTGMPVWWVSEPYINLWISDEPLGYQPPYGPGVSFRLHYKQREQAAGSNNAVFSTGHRWNNLFLSYVTDQGTSPNQAKILLPGGGEFVMVPDNATVHYHTNLKMERVPATGTTTSFKVHHPDGSVDVYGNKYTAFISSNDTYFLTERIDPMGNKLTFAYTPASAPSSSNPVKLTTITDAASKTNTFSYAHGTFPNVITGITDPYSRSVTLGYDSNRRLTSITDVEGIYSSFGYSGSTHTITSMTTPYGTTSFSHSESIDPAYGLIRSLDITEPNGSHQLYLFKDETPQLSGYASGTAPNTSSFGYSSNFDTSNLHKRNSYHWGRQQYDNLSTTTIASFTTADYLKARTRHWLLDSFSEPSNTLSVERDPSPDPAGGSEGQVTWYDYYGKPNAYTVGSQRLPLFVARLIPDGPDAGTDPDTWFEYTILNGIGNVATNITTYSLANGTVDTRTELFEYAGNGIDLLKYWDAGGHLAVSNYFNAYHQILHSHNAVGERTEYLYDGSRRLISTKLPTGLFVTNLFNGDGFVSSVREFVLVSGSPSYLSTNSYTYDKGLVFSHLDERGLNVTNYYDNLQRLTGLLYPDGTYITNFYENLDLVKTLDRLGYTNTFGYNSVRQLTAHTNALGTVTRYGYCECGALGYVTNAWDTALEQVTHFVYDNQGRRTETYRPDGWSITNRYNLLGQVTNVADAISSVTNYFNNQGSLVLSSNAFGLLVKNVFDEEDRLIETIDQNGVKTTLTYDDLGRLRTRTWPANSAVEAFGYEQNVFGLRFYTNQLAKVTRYGYDAKGRKTYETNALGHVTQFIYSPAGDLNYLADGKAQLTQWVYDQYGQVTNKLDDSSNLLLTYQYDANGRMTTRASISKGQTQYAYDAAGNLTNVNYNVSPDIALAYDALGRLTNMVDAVGTSRFTWSTGNQLLSEDGPWADDTVSYSHTNNLRQSLALAQPGASPWAQAYTYDAAKRLQILASPAGTFAYNYHAGVDGVTASTRLLKGINLPNTSYITNSYDGLARQTATLLRNSADSGLNWHAYTYNAGNQRTLTIAYPNNRRVFYNYDDIGQLLKADGQEASGTIKPHEQFGYKYDAAGNLHQRTNNALVQTFTVDNVNRLTGGSRSGTLTVAGTTSSTASSVTVNGSAATTYTDFTFARTGLSLSDGNNTFTAVASDAFGRSDTNAVTVWLPAAPAFDYDLNGNLLSDRRRAFAYDDENQLISVTMTNQWRSEFVYDGKLRRKIRKEFIWDGTWWVQTNEVRYVYDGNLVIQERDGNNEPQVTYTRGSDLSGELEGAGGIGGLLARTDNGKLTDAHAYYHADGNGNVTMLLNGSQAIAAHYQYDPYGNLMNQRGPLAEANFYRFSSKELHPASGLIYYLYRYYEPNLQRWINRDPIGEWDGANLFRSFFNEPLGFVDDTGLQAVTTIIRVSVEVGVRVPPTPRVPGVSYPRTGPFPPRGLNENPFRPGDWGRINPQTKKWEPCWRFDKGKPGAPGWGGKDHFHYWGSKEHLPSPPPPFKWFQIPGVNKPPATLPVPPSVVVPPILVPPKPANPCPDGACA